jgi:hypothetical protein
LARGARLCDERCVWRWMRCAGLFALLLASGCAVMDAQFRLRSRHAVASHNGWIPIDRSDFTDSGGRRRQMTSSGASRPRCRPAARCSGAHPPYAERRELVAAEIAALETP